MIDFEAVLTILAGAGLMGAYNKIKTSREAFDGFCKTLSRVQDVRRWRQESAAGAKLIGFEAKDQVTYHNDNVHPLFEGRANIHPDNMAALHAAMGARFAEALENHRVQVEDRLTGRLDDNLVLTGSATSEGISRLVFGYVTLGDEDSLVLSSKAPMEFPYTLILDRSEVPQTKLARRYVEGRGEVARPNWMIRAKKHLYIPTLSREGWLETDYLLLTRVRNYLTEDGVGTNRAVISVAGTHGVGTRALELVLRDNRILRRSAEAAENQDCPSFQALFRVSHIRHDARWGSAGRQIELIEDIKMLDDDPARWDAAKRIITPQVKEWRGSPGSKLST